MVSAADFDYDVFLSHGTADKPAVEELARRLKRERIEPWLDKWNLIPGQECQLAMERALADCATCAVFIGPGGLGPWQNEEMRAAIARRVGEKEGQFRVIPVLLPGMERPERGKLPAFLTATTWVEFRNSLDDEETFRRLLCGIRGEEPGAGPDGAPFAGQCPYRGLEVFDVEHAPFFFGREALTEWLIVKLRASPSGQENRFLAILGASGSGKSSLARAGLVPALERGALDGSGEWPIVVLKPGRDPIESLAVALAGLDGTRPSPVAVQGLMAALCSAENTLHLTARLALREAPPSRRLVVLVDQFEEVFTLCEDEAARRALFDNLLYAATVAGGRAIVVLTMRADFYGKCGAYPALAAAMSDNQLLVGPMTEDELRRAIERPAQLAGGEFEPGLVDLLVEEVKEQSSALPLLQDALLALWNRERGYRLTNTSYRELGGLKGALEKRANEVYEQFSEPERATCRQVFLRLIHSDEGTPVTKRRASLADITPSGEGAAAIRDMIQKLVMQRLITTGKEAGLRGGDFVEIGHEALIRHWPALKEWIAANRVALRVQERLSIASKEWNERNRDPDLLYKGLRLLEVETSLREDSLNSLERDFLEATRKRAREEAPLESQPTPPGLRVIRFTPLRSLTVAFVPNLKLMVPSLLSSTLIIVALVFLSYVIALWALETVRGGKDSTIISATIAILCSFAGLSLLGLFIYLLYNGYLLTFDFARRRYRITNRRWPFNFFSGWKPPFPDDLKLDLTVTPRGWVAKLSFAGSTLVRTEPMSSRDAAESQLRPYASALNRGLGLSSLQIENFHYKEVNKDGKAVGGSRSGELRDDGLVLDGNHFPSQTIVRTHVRVNRIVLFVATETEGGVIPLILEIRSGKAMAQELKRRIDQANSDRSTRQHLEKLQSSGGRERFRSESCPHCGVTIDLTGFPSSPQIYCPYCETITSLGGKSPSTESHFHLCESCGFFSRTRLFIGDVIIWLYLYYISYIRYRSKRNVLCYSCMRGRAWKVVFSNFMLVGLPMALYRLLVAYLGSWAWSSPFSGLDAANRHAGKRRTARAEELYQSILARVPHAAGVHYNRAKMRSLAGDPGGCLDAINAAWADCANYDPALPLYLKSLEALGRTNEVHAVRTRWGLS